MATYQQKFETHTVIDYNGLDYCTACKGGEIDLRDSCEVRQMQNKIRDFINFSITNEMNLGMFWTGLEALHLDIKIDPMHTLDNAYTCGCTRERHEHNRTCVLHELMNLWSLEYNFPA